MPGFEWQPLEVFMQILFQYFDFFPMFNTWSAFFQLCISFCDLQEKTMFSIPWKHAARHGWELNKDASLFKLWAIHTGEQTWMYMKTL